jgi:hypothetical protein
MEITTQGKLLKVACIPDEDFCDGIDPSAFLGVKADIIAFTQKLPGTHPKLNYTFEWDNVAAIVMTTYDDWWKSSEHQLQQNVRRAAKCGIVVSEAPLDDQLIKGIVEIYNETQIRQGRAFRNYGKDFNQVKKDMNRFIDRSIFLGAYLDGELVGFMKLVEVGVLGCVLHLVCKTSHNNKKPANALIAKAVEVCTRRGLTHLTYGKYVYESGPNSLTDFKRRNGFAPIQVPRYFIPLTLKGKVGMCLKMHRGVKSLIPERLMALMRRVRAWYCVTVIKHRECVGEREPMS